MAAKKKAQHLLGKRAVQVSPKKEGVAALGSKGQPLPQSSLLPTFRSKGSTFAVFRIEG
jgi:hypothetical protein